MFDEFAELSKSIISVLGIVLVSHMYRMCMESICGICRKYAWDVLGVSLVCHPENMHGNIM